MDLSLQNKIHQRPLLIYDGLSPFCLLCLKLIKWFTYQKIHYLPVQQIKHFIVPDDFKSYSGSFFYLNSAGIIYKNLEAFLHILAPANLIFRLLNILYKRFFYFRIFSHFIFDLLNKLYSILLKNKSRNDEYQLISDLFVRLLGLIYFCAFFSLLLQVKGLYGQEGILPFSLIFKWFSYEIGFNDFLKIPSLFWMNQSTFFIVTLTSIGILFSILLIIGILPFVSLFLLWLIYLSVVSAGLIFMQYQWDILLLEISFLSFFICPLSFTLYSKKKFKVSTIVIFAFRLLLFKLYFTSGLVKVINPQSSWLNGDALMYHFQTQPLPQISSWLLHKLPTFILKIGTICVLFIELFVPFLFFLNKYLRLISFFIINSFMISIIFTGNFGFFNFLAIILSVFLLDDNFIKKRLSHYSKSSFIIKRSWLYNLICSSLALFICFYSISNQFFRFIHQKQPFLKDISNLINPFFISNSYGLFAHMTKKRYELDIQASMDAITWVSYKFKFKPNDSSDFPLFIAPYHPRLDWQLWFSSLRNYSDKSWINYFIDSLFLQKKDVLNLLSSDSKVNFKPQFIRIIRYEYRFSDIKTLKNKKIWNKKFNDIYLKPVKNPF